jgi:Resolvase, N terminal domain
VAPSPTIDLLAEFYPVSAPEAPADPPAGRFFASEEWGFLLKPRRSFQRNQRHCGGPLHSARVRLRSEKGLPSCHIEFLSFGYAAASTSKLTVLGGLAEFERELIRARTGEGRERAKAKGVKMGRRPKLTGHPDARGDQAPRSWRGDAGRDWPQLQCVRLDDCEASTMKLGMADVERSL